MNNNGNLWDVAVIGGGPAGMMAAGRSAELGAKVILIEKNDKLGKKLLITGGGRCNVTNAELDNRKLLERFRDDGKFLHSTFSQWSVKETLDFFHAHNMETKVENENRVFPTSNKSQSVWDVIVGYMKAGNVTVLSDSPVIGLTIEDSEDDHVGVPLENPEKDPEGKYSRVPVSNRISSIKLKNGDVVRARSIVIATGGTSHPETGSTGDAYAWLTKTGHKIIEPTPSLVPLAVRDQWVKSLSGVSLTNIKITPFLDGVKQNIKGKIAKKGLAAPQDKILFTHFGVSGPTILNMSKAIGEMLPYGDVTISLDLLPELDYAKLNLKLQEVFKDNDKKKFKNSLDILIPSAIAPVVIELSGIDPNVQCNSVTREERLKLVTLLKNITIRIDRLLGTDKAIVSSGGVSLEEVDFRTMQSRICPNLYLVGDILNIDRPSGGFSLQLCWTTGYVAGTNAAKGLRSEI